MYDLSSALELDWYEDIGLCKPGEAEKLLRDGDTRLGGRVPVNPSGGLSCFGEAIPAQAIAQVCECVWQLRGEAAGPPGEGCPSRCDREPGSVRPRLVGARHSLRCAAAGSLSPTSVSLVQKSRTSKRECYLIPKLGPDARCTATGHRSPTSVSLVQKSRISKRECYLIPKLDRTLGALRPATVLRRVSLSFRNRTSKR